MSDNEVGLKRPKPLFDRTITYGHILTAISFVVAGTAAFFGMKAELQNVDQRVARIEATQGIPDPTGCPSGDSFERLGMRLRDARLRRRCLGFHSRL